jgi:hypothetical protein
MSKKLAKPFLLMHHSMNTEYLKYNKIPKKYRVEGREELRKLIKTICKHIGNEIVEKPGGVHIRRLGYFFVWKIPRKTTYHKKIKGGKLEENYNYHTNHYMYSPIFLPSIDKNRTFADWSMDNSFTSTVKQGIKNKVSSGFKYKIYPYSIQALNKI